MTPDVAIGEAVSQSLWPMWPTQDRCSIAGRQTRALDRRTLYAPEAASRALPPADDPAPGDTVGAYRLISILGEGSTGRVFAAQHEATREVVALKLLYPALVGDGAVLQRFINEARAVRRVEHPNIVEISALIIDEGHHFLVMELLRGQTLDARLMEGGKLPLARAIAIASEVCDALAAAHAVGVVHRDLKPGNIFLSRKDGREQTMIIDFGVAKMLGPAAIEDAAGIRVVIGTPTYMAPEQTRGEQIDHRVDIYALGVLLYEMVTGEVPFARPSLHELIDAHRHAAPPPPRLLVPELPEQLEQLILSCLAKDPRDRPVSMADVESALCTIGQRIAPSQAT